jgi:hypothetical protein
MRLTASDSWKSVLLTREKRGKNPVPKSQITANLFKPQKQKSPLCSVLLHR